MMPMRIQGVIVAGALAGAAALAPTPAAARTFVSFGFGVPGYYGGYYAPPPVAVGVGYGGYWGRPYWRRPYWGGPYRPYGWRRGWYGRPYGWRRW
jgi:hypothetical protein